MTWRHQPDAGVADNPQYTPHRPEKLAAWMAVTTQSPTGSDYSLVGQDRSRRIDAISDIRRIKIWRFGDIFRHYDNLAQRDDFGQSSWAEQIIDLVRSNITSIKQLLKEMFFGSDQ